MIRVPTQPSNNPTSSGSDRWIIWSLFLVPVCCGLPLLIAAVAAVGAAALGLSAAAVAIVVLGVVGVVVRRRGWTKGRKDVRQG